MEWLVMRFRPVQLLLAFFLLSGLVWSNPSVLYA